jgi:hypothetical protein
MKVILDRFEGDKAVIELPDLSFAAVPAVLFKGAKEGDVFDILPDNEGTIARKTRIAALMDSAMGGQQAPQ